MTTTTEPTRHLDQLHFEHQLWRKEMKFYKEELLVFNKWLQEIGGKYSRKDVLSQLEHFQNQFILQNEQADQLLHDLNSHEQELSAAAAKNPVAVDHRAFADHPLMRDRISSFLQIYRDLKNEYMKFLSKVM